MSNSLPNYVMGVVPTMTYGIEKGIIDLRPHHAIKTPWEILYLFDESKFQAFLREWSLGEQAVEGYSKEFTDNHERILTAIRKNPEMRIRVVLGKDILCRSCARTLPDGTPIKCDTLETDKDDKKWAKEYGIKIGAEYNAKELLERNFNAWIGMLD